MRLGQIAFDGKSIDFPSEFAHVDVAYPPIRSLTRSTSRIAQVRTFSEDTIVRITGTFFPDTGDLIRALENWLA